MQYILNTSFYFVEGNCTAAQPQTKIIKGTLMTGYGTPGSFALCKQECNARVQCTALDWQELDIGGSCRLFRGDVTFETDNNLNTDFTTVICHNANNGAGMLYVLSSYE